MNYIRELLYRPKRSDKSLLARFYFADMNLNAVAAELDSFDGRKVRKYVPCVGATQIVPRVETSCLITRAKMLKFAAFRTRIEFSIFR